MIPRIAVAAAAISLSMSAVLAEPPRPADAESPAGGAAALPAIGALPLDKLFDRLAAAIPGEPGEPGKAIEAEIVRRLETSGSDTADLLMSWAAQAVAEKQYPLALDILDQVVVLKPDHVEAWNRRATVHYLRDDYSSSLADIRRTLTLEPRHFGALSGLGLILEATGKTEQALAVYRRALAIDPLLGKVRESLERLEEETARNSI